MTITPTTTADVGVLAALYGAVAAGDPERARAVLHPDVILHVPGAQPLSGDHHGVEAVLGFLAASTSVADGAEDVEVLDLLTGDRHVAAYCRVTGERAGRAPLENRTVHLYRLDAGRIAEVWFHNWDQGAVDAFWS